MRNSFSGSDTERFTHVDIWGARDTTLSGVAHDRGEDFSELYVQALRAKSVTKRITFMILKNAKNIVKEEIPSNTREDF
jgi:hypothetical protein